MQKNTANKIKEFITKHCSQESSNSKGSFQVTNQSTTKILIVDKIQEKYNQRLINFFETERSARITEEEINKKHNRDHLIEARIQEIIDEHKKKNQEKLQKQKARLTSLAHQRKIQEEFVVERINRSSISPRRISTTEKRKKNNFENFNRKDEDIDYKLEEINKKFLKSSENYAKNLQEKVENLHNKHRVLSLTNSFEYNEKIKLISEKYENASFRRQKLKQEFDEKVQRKEAKMQNKTKRVGASL